MNSDELKDRTKKFALNIIKLAKDLPNNSIGRIIENQLVKQEHQSVQITEQLAEQNQMLISFIR